MKRLAETLDVAARTKLGRFTGLSHESPTMLIFVKIKPQVDEPSFYRKRGYGWGPGFGPVNRHSFEMALNR